MALLPLARWAGLALVVAACAPDPVTTPDDTDVPPVVLSQAPGVAEVAVVPPQPRALAQDLRCEVQVPAVDPDGEAVSYEVLWWVDGSPFVGAVTVHHPGDTVPADQVRAGQVWACGVVAVDPGGVRGPMASSSARVRVPNVLLLVVDDMGVSDISPYGGLVDTPHLDALADEGVRFTSGYVASPVCGPSRAGLITGRQPSRFGLEFNLGNPVRVEEQERGLPFDEITMADVLADAGLSTSLIGKWHLGFYPQHHPLSRGFDDFFGFLSGQRYSIEPGLPGSIDAWPYTNSPPNWPIDHFSDGVTHHGDTVVIDPEEHLTDRFAAEAVRFLDAQGGAPFFLMLSFNAPHEPVQATADMLDQVPATPDDPGGWAYRASIKGIDTAVGRVLDHLDTLGLADDTVVVFLSDHGCNESFGWCSNAPFDGGKLRLTEGGLRVPMIARWPGRIPAGVVEERAVSSMDWLPTFAAAVGGAPDAGVPLDGVDLLPWLVHGQAGAPHDELTWRLGNARAILQGDDKLVQVFDDVWLFDVRTDPGETVSRAADEASRVDALLGRLDARDGDYVLPMWNPQTVEVGYFGVMVEIPF